MLELLLVQEIQELRQQFNLAYAEVSGLDAQSRGLSSAQLNKINKDAKEAEKDFKKTGTTEEAERTTHVSAFKNELIKLTRRAPSILEERIEIEEMAPKILAYGGLDESVKDEIRTIQGEYEYAREAAEKATRERESDAEAKKQAAESKRGEYVDAINGAIDVLEQQFFLTDREGTTQAMSFSGEKIHIEDLAARRRQVLRMILDKQESHPGAEADAIYVVLQNGVAIDSLKLLFD